MQPVVAELADLQRLPYGRRLDYILMNHEDGGYLLRMIRAAKSVQALVDVYRLVYPLYEDLCLTELQPHYVAGLAAGPVPLDQMRAIISGLKINAPSVARAYKEVSYAWPSGFATLSDHQFMVFAIKRLAELDADPTCCGLWRPFIHPADASLKSKAASALVTAPCLCERKIQGWLDSGTLTSADAVIVQGAWEAFKSRREYDKMANSGQFPHIDIGSSTSH